MKLKDLEVERYRLEKPLSLPKAPGRERYVHVLVGEGEVPGPFGARALRRRSIFDPPTAGIYLRGSDPLEIKPRGALDVIVASAPASEMQSVVVEPKLHEIGDGNARRRVWEILGGDGPSARLRLGETQNERGGWSSWPPHSFDHDPTLASEFEEVFLPFLRPRASLAMMRRKGVYWDGAEVDDAVVVRSGDLLSVPLGSHPIVAGPDTDLKYVFIYLSPIPKVYGKWAEDAGGYK